MKPSTKPLIVSILCVIALLLGVVASLVLGSRRVSFEEIIGGLSHSIPQSLGESVVQKRIPRTVFGIFAGASLGMSGALMQAITRNPLADPGILGVNTGAALFVVIGIAFLGITTPQQYIFLALIGASISAVFVYTIGSIGGKGATPVKLALAGSATAAALSSLVSAIMLPRTAVMDVFRFWQVGGIGGATWATMRSILPFLLVGLIIGLMSSSSLNALALGDDVATGLGVRTGRARMIAAGGGVILCGATTALAGPISFVGLMVPHVIRLGIGVDQRWIIPLSAIGGAVVVLFSDVIGRLIGSPGELEAGIVTAFIGAPVLIAVAARSKVREI
jgi:iron complex transport system permease protein